MSGNRRKRLERLEEKYADLARQEELANCICQTRIVAYSTKIFEAEMNKTCPAHGFRRLGRIMIACIVPTRKDRADSVDERSVGLDELVKEYQRRLAEVEQAEDEQEYGSQES
jgi:hypothetical protein